MFLVDDNGKRSRIRGIKQAMKAMDIPYDAIYGVSASKFNYFTLRQIKSDFGVTSS